MDSLYLGLGANSGDRVETLLRAAGQLGRVLGSKGFRCSSVFGDLHRRVRTGATVNMMLRLDGINPNVQDGIIVAQLHQVEDSFGRVRNADREMPVSLDVDLIGRRRGPVTEWNARYDRGCHYLWQGLYELQDEALRAELERLAIERDFTPAENAKGFYPLLSRHFSQSVIAAETQDVLVMDAAVA